MDNQPVPVVFRVSDGVVMAVFPAEPSDIAAHFMSCYAHVGQHGGCSYEWYRTTRPATPDEYRRLASELRAVGYALKVYRRITRQHRVAFNTAIRRRSA